MASACVKRLGDWNLLRQVMAVVPEVCELRVMVQKLFAQGGTRLMNGEFRDGAGVSVVPRASMEGNQAQQIYAPPALDAFAHQTRLL